MTDIHQPHDRLFRTVFANPAEATSLLQANLSPEVRDSFSWTTLTLRNGTFIDTELAGSPRTRGQPKAARRHQPEMPELRV